MDTVDQKPLGRIIGDIARMQATRAHQALGPSELFRGQAIILLTVAEQEGITHSEIAKALSISPAAASKMIKRLEDRRLLQRTVDPSDERVSRVVLRKEGRAVIRQVHRSFAQVEQRMLAGLSDQDREVLRDMLSRIHANLLRIRA